MSKQATVLTLGVCLHILTSSLFAGQLVAWGRNEFNECNIPTGNDFVAVQGGTVHGIALRTDGSIVQWGSDPFCVPFGSLPTGNNNIIAIAAKRNHNLALKSDGSIIAWGCNDNGQCNVPDGNYTAIAAGSYHSVAIRSNGSLAAWGYNNHDQCNVPSGNNYTAVAAGFSQSLAIKSDGSLIAWGSDSFDLDIVPPGNNFVAIACGFGHNLALRSNGTLVAWGYNYSGQCDVPTDNDFIAIDADNYYSMALHSDGTLEAWGYNSSGNTTVPVGDGFTAISAGYATGFAIQSQPVQLTSLNIVGPSSISEEFPTQYEAIAHYVDGSTRDATNSAIWTITPAPIASIDSDGMLKTISLDATEIITIHAQLTEEGIEVQDHTSVGICPSALLKVPQEYPNIQAAINAARDGDTVLVADGTYIADGNYNIRFNGKAITVESENGAQDCIIDCRQQGRGFTFDSNESQYSTLNGFSIINGRELNGAGIFIDEADPVIRNCILSDNTIVEGNGDGTGWGAGIYCHNAGAEIINCLFINNSTVYSGGAVYMSNYTEITDVINCTIISNTADNGAGIWCRNYGTVKNCIIRDNNGNQIAGEFEELSVTYSNIEGSWPGTGNIDANPLFIDAARKNFNLQTGSPCIDAADTTVFSGHLDTIDLNNNPRAVNDHLSPDSGLTLAIPFAGNSAADMGAYEYQPCILTLKGDLNCDEQVNMLDLIILVNNWLQ